MTIKVSNSGATAEAALPTSRATAITRSMVVLDARATSTEINGAPTTTPRA